MIFLRIFKGKFRFLAFVLILFTGPVKKAHSQVKISSPGISAGMGRSKNHADIYRLGFRVDTPNLSDDRIGYLGGIIEVSSNLWKGEETIFAAAISPIFAYYFDFNKWKVMPYLEAGIGFSYISGTFINDRILSSHFQFEDRLGFGVRTPRFDYNLRYLHFSNANFKTPNQGMDMLVVSLGYYLGR